MIWWNFRKLFIGEAVANLLLNFLLGYYWGMDGIIVATIITVLIFSIVGIGWKTMKIYFNRSPREYFILCIIYLIVTIGVSGITYGICMLYNNNPIFSLAIRLVICCIIPNMFIFVLSYINKTTRGYMMEFLVRIKTAK